MITENRLNEILDKLDSGEDSGITEEESKEINTYHDDWGWYSLDESIYQMALEKKQERLRCDSCQVTMINGVRCHETGCPEQG